MNELERVLVEKLGFSEETIRAATQLLEHLAAERPGTPEHVDPITGDPADDAILACAVEVKADVLATGDRKHLLPLGDHGGVRLLTPQAFLAELRDQGF